MKKILFAVCLFCALQLSAQSKSSLEKKLTKSDAETVDPKKGINPKTWMNRGDLFVDIYELPVKNIMIGLPQIQVKTILKAEKFRTDYTEQGEEIWIYPDKKLYFSADGMLSFWEITAFVTSDPLVKAYEAYSKAYELDLKKSNAKKLRQALTALSSKLIAEASSAFQLGRHSDALNYFETSLKCTEHPAVNTVDTAIVYNAGLAASLANNNEKALQHYRHALELGYEVDGNTRASISQLLRAQGDTIQANEMLANAVVKFPNNQGILVQLINAYMADGSNLSEVMPYIKQAQENEPNNASIYNTEGVIYEEMGDNEKAITCYKKAIEVDPSYFIAQYRLGALHYNTALKIQDDANDPAIDDATYTSLIAKMDEELKASIPYFARAYELEPNEPAIIEHLKSIYFRFREQPGMQEKYDYYDGILKNMQAQ